MYFGGDQERDQDPEFPDQEIFKGFFTYFRNSCRQSRIKHDDPRRRFALSECFLVCVCFYCCLNRDK